MKITIVINEVGPNKLARRLKSVGECTDLELACAKIVCEKVAEAFQEDKRRRGITTPAQVNVTASWPNHRG